MSEFLAGRAMHTGCHPAQSPGSHFECASLRSSNQQQGEASFASQGRDVA
jgi:hypothetical protein